jgi:GTP cyclohydrolase I
VAVDTAEVEKHIRGLLEAIGENPDRPGLRETPARVARMYAEVFQGIAYTNGEIAAQFGKTFAEDGGQGDLVQVRDIEVFSYCEHHLALMYDMKVSVSYLPRGKILGLSKIARIADMAARRLQLQERLGADIAEIMTLATGSPDVAVTIEACHSCMTARGIQKPGAKTLTTTLRGRFAEDAALQARL